VIFVDTSGLYAVLDRGDRHHVRAAEVWELVVGGTEPLVTSSYVRLELHALVQARLGLDAVRVLVSDCLTAIQVLAVSDAIHGRAFGALLAAGRRQLSLVDCVSFEVMREHSIRSVFAFDPHFEEQGFELRPAAD